jgi:L-ascorbate metabolism protein UlaG (beta-lactamase superfamily)
MKYKNIELKWLGQSGFLIKSLESGTFIYVDPFKLRLDEEYYWEKNEQADFIFITHSHYDHCSIEDIQKICKDGTIIVCTADSQSKFRHINKKVNIMFAEIGRKTEFKDKNISFWAVPAYNTKNKGHDKNEDWVGYIIQIDNVSIYHAGDTDLIPEMSKLKATNLDIALLPIGGTYTMNAGEAAKAASVIKPKIAIPMHYASIEGVGSRSDADLFLKYCSVEGIEARVLEKS